MPAIATDGSGPRWTRYAATAAMALLAVLALAPPAAAKACQGKGKGSGCVVNQPPMIGGMPPTSAREGQAYSFQPTTSDPDGDPLVFSITNKPAWASFEVATGRLYGTPGTGTVGVYANIVIRVSDGAATTALPAFTITVEQVALGTATLSWLPPTTRTDGSPLVNLAGYRIHYGTAPTAFPNRIQLANAGLTTYVVENLPPGTWYFSATAYDANGAESDYSSVVSKTIH